MSFLSARRPTRLVAGSRQRGRVAIGRPPPWWKAHLGRDPGDQPSRSRAAGVALTRADRPCALNRRASGRSRALVQVLITATALLVIVLVGTGAHSSASQLERPADLVVTHVNADIAAVVATRPAVHPLQTPTWSGPGGDTDSAATFSAGVLASLLVALLALVRPTRRPSQPAQALPRWRGPPQVAFGTDIC